MIYVLVEGIVTKFTLEEFKAIYSDVINILINNGVILKSLEHTCLNHMYLYDEIGHKIGLYIPEASYHCFKNHAFARVLRGDATVIFDNGTIYIFELKHSMSYLNLTKDIIGVDSRIILNIEETSNFKKIVKDYYICDPKKKHYADELMFYFNDPCIMEQYKLKLSAYDFNTKINFRSNLNFDIAKFNMDDFVKNMENVRHFKENLFLKYPKNIMPSHHGISS